MEPTSAFHGSRVLLVRVQTPNPFFDDSYAVNSENLGPWGDALTYELIPEIERRFRGLGAWVRLGLGLSLTLTPPPAYPIPCPSLRSERRAVLRVHRSPIFVF